MKGEKEQLKLSTFQMKPCCPLMCSQPKKKSSVFLKSKQIAHFALVFFLPEHFSVTLRVNMIPVKIDSVKR